MEIRPARPEELGALPALEVAAGELFREIGMARIADDAPPTVEQLAAAPAVLVAIGEDGTPVGYARIEVVDGHAHLGQLSVHPDHGRRGIGTALLDAVVRWAADRGDTSITLTTFRDVPWNAPLYRKRGYADLPASEWGPELAAAVASEADHGLDPATRTVMRRPVSPDRRP
jgi:GNAT superfamily N-acetyltransferase